MTRPRSRLSLRTELHQDVVTLHVSGSLEYGVTDRLVSGVTDQLDAPRAHGRTVGRLDLDLAELEFVDSMGLAALLMIRRLTDARAVTLGLLHRPVCLERLLQLTGTLGHLTAAAPPSAAATEAETGDEDAAEDWDRRFSGTE